MAYSDFTLRESLERLKLSLLEVPDLFGDVEPVEPGPLLRALLPEFVPLALAINTEKARSELVIAPFLAALWAQMGHRFSIFSGIDFTVDPSQGLAGFCDFILSRSTQQQFLQSPVAAIVEAKNDNLKGGLGQCIAEMFATRLFNEREGQPETVVHGAVTTGSLWRFLRLSSTQVTLDGQEYHLQQVPKLIGIFRRILGLESVSSRD